MRTIIKTEHPEHGTHYWHYEGKEIDADHIEAWPIGGGFGKRIPKSHVKEWDTQIPPVYRYCEVGFDEPYLPKFMAWVNPHDRWNGWAKPLVEREQLLRFIAEQDRLAAESPEADYTTAVLDGNTLVVSHHGSEGPDDVERIEPQTILVPGTNGEQRNVEVWDIGLGLIWDEMDEKGVES